MNLLYQRLRSSLRGRIARDPLRAWHFLLYGACRANLARTCASDN